MYQVQTIVVSFFIVVFLLLIVYLAFKYRRGKSVEFVKKRFWLHPNYICVWRTLLAFFADFLYFATPYRELGIFLFTTSSALDGVDGIVARYCDLITETGKEVDPLCDKLTYLPPIIIFGYYGYLSIYLAILLAGVDLLGQLLRRVMAGEGYMMSATIFGKVKTALCFVLVIYCAALNGGAKIAMVGNGLLKLCIALAVASIISKMPIKKIINGQGR